MENENINIYYLLLFILIIIKYIIKIKVYNLQLLKIFFVILTKFISYVIILLGKKIPLIITS